MKTFIQKSGIYAVLTALLTILPLQVSAQVDYYEDFTSGSEELLWSQIDFHTTDVAVCGNGSAFRANPVSNAGTVIPAEAVSKSLGISNGEEIVLAYNYKLLQYDDVLPFRPLTRGDWGSVMIEYGPTQNGPWTVVDIITDENYAISSECTTRKVSFIPNEGDEVYLRIYADAEPSKEVSYYFYIEDLSLFQDGFTIDPILVQEHLQVQPNPVTDYATVIFDGRIDSIALFNMQGQEVRVWDLDSDFRRLDMSGLTYGEYVLHVTTGGTVRTINVMKD